MTIKKQFAKYVSQNILGMLGMSCYILADTYFIATAMGENGITALNLVLPLYNLIFAIGAMIGVGSAIRFTVEKHKGEEKAGFYFGNAIFFSGVISVLFILAGIFLPAQIIGFLGGDAVIIETGRNYTRIFLVFAPLFMWNHICNAFVRNDGAPAVAMTATLVSSLFNIVFDYVLMFPFHMGMEGAAIATALSPAVGIAICCMHLFSKKSGVQLLFHHLSIRCLVHSCQVGVSAFIGEISSGVITLVFNYLIMEIAGNIGVAAYGVVANVSLVAVAVFNGVANGNQPLISRNFGKGNKENVRELTLLGLGTAIVLAAIIYAGICIGAEWVTMVFNSDGDLQFAAYANKGQRIYFIGIFFAGINIVGSSMLSAVESAKWAFAVSVLRGFVLIIGFAFLFAKLMGMTGVWMAYPVAEAATMCVTLYGVCTYLKKRETV